MSKVETDAEDARRYRWLKANMMEKSTGDEESGYNNKAEYVFPTLTSYVDACGVITLDEAIDMQTGDFLGDD